MKRSLPEWFKVKGYLHLTPPVNLRGKGAVLRYIESERCVAQHAFYPLIHRIITERKYKKGDLKKNGTKERAHKHYDVKAGRVKSTVKKRPIHYATHIDALIMSYYAKFLSDIYYAKIKQDPALDAAITAYRSIKVEANSNEGKSSIHFAKEAFDLIRKKADEWNGCSVLTFDLKSFFSTLDHQYLKRLWVNLLHEYDCQKYSPTKLPNDHYNVFKACTNFSYILLDDLRAKVKRRGKKSGFDEGKLAQIRREKGYRAFFADNEDFRKSIKEGKLRIYKSPFFKIVGNKKVRMGIPQGLPISSILANLYMSEFDKLIIEEWTKKKGYVYRRYSDDILIICKMEDAKALKQYICEKIEITKVEISTEKTEIFQFKNDLEFNRLTSYKLDGDNERWVKGAPLIYLGFEFRGYNVAIKSSNLAKYYRRIIALVKRRAIRVRKMCELDPTTPNAIFRGRLRKLYNQPLRNRDPEKFLLQGRNMRLIKKLEMDTRGNYQYRVVGQREPRPQSNYVGYVNRCCKVFGSELFRQQIRKRRRIAHEAIQVHFYGRKK